MPIEREIEKIPKQWIINVAYTVIGESFSAWAYDQIKVRNDKVKKEKDLNIAMDPKIADMFMNS